MISISLLNVLLHLTAAILPGITIQHPTDTIEKLSGSQYDNARACVVFVASVVLGNTQLDQGFI